MVAGSYLGSDTYASFDGTQTILTANDGEVVITLGISKEVFKLLRSYGNEKFNLIEDDDYPDGE